MENEEFLLVEKGEVVTVQGLRREEILILLAIIIGLGGVGWFLLPAADESIMNVEESEMEQRYVWEEEEKKESIVVHVAGAVMQPGVYELNSDSRILDALQAAGGAQEDAALDSINLAAPLQDGTQVRIPILGEEDEGGDTRTLNINMATATELETLPGIGPTRAQEILRYREEQGPFRSVEDLLEISGIGDSTLNQIKDLVRLY